MKTRTFCIDPNCLLSNEPEVCGHFGTSAEVVGDFSALMQNWSGHFEPKMLVPKWFDTEVS